MSNSDCLHCAGTGRTLNMEACTKCKVSEEEVKRVNPDTVPKAYQDITEFDSSFLPSFVGQNYKNFMQELYNRIRSSCSLELNLLLCSPNNSGKTILAYSVYNHLFARGLKYLPLIDLIEARDLLQGYSRDREKLLLLEKSPVVFIVLPQDTPHRFVDIMTSVVQRRVRNGGGTVFLYGGSYNYLESIDTFGRLKAVAGDGSYSSILIEKFGRNDFDKEES